MSDELSELGKAAVWYCEHGFAIVPLNARGKIPAMKHGLNDWFDNPESARDVWSKFPNYNIGIVCGAPSHGLLVLDFDIDEEREKDGYATLRAWERAQGDLPETAVAITGSGGMHYLYRTNRNNIRPSANAELGVDVRCDGSYIVAPPSIHPNGRAYTWQDHPEDTPIATADGNVYDFLDHIQRNGGVDETRKENGKFKLPDEIENDRNTTLFRYATHLRAIGRSDEEIMNTVMGVNLIRCKPPLDDKEVRSIVKSACKYERGEDGGSEIAVSGAPGKSAGGGGDFPQFRKVKADGTLGAIQHNILARGIMQCDHACKIDGALAVWGGRKWEFGVGALKSICQEHADDISKSKKSEVVDYIANSKSLVSITSTNGFDGRYYVQFKNGTYDVLSGSLVEPDNRMFIVGTLPVELDLDAPYGVADHFLESVSDGDEATEKVLREIIGACMCSMQIIDQAVMLIGRANGVTAANGKSTYINMLRALIGQENTSTLDIAMFGKPFYVAGLIGKLANLGDDIPASYLHGDEASVFKRAVTGDSIRADVKFGDQFEFMPRAVQIFSMNVIPRLPADDDGLYRRLAFVPFRRHFEPGCDGYDPHIIETLTKPDNLRRFAVLGLQELPDLIRHGKLTRIEDMDREMDEVRKTNNVVLRWMAAVDISAEELNERWTDDVYAEFGTWADSAGETRNKVTQQIFTRRVLATLDTLTVKQTRDRVSGKRGRKFATK